MNCHAKEDFNFFCTLQRAELGLLGRNYKASGFNLVCLDFQRIRVPQATNSQVKEIVIKMFRLSTNDKKEMVGF